MELREGERIVEIDPAPVLKDITLDVAERGLVFMGIELDDLMDGEAEAKPVKFADRDAFMDAILENEINLNDYSIQEARAALEVISANFYFDCLMSFSGLETVKSA